MWSHSRTNSANGWKQFVIADTTAETVAEKFVYEFCSRLGLPFELHSDQGRNYEASLFRQVCSPCWGYISYGALLSTHLPMG